MATNHPVKTQQRDISTNTAAADLTDSADFDNKTVPTWHSFLAIQHNFCLFDWQ
ncbi:hypothetical protein [Polluticoccus soli]|uniref:hypothetical protein n=1 Tax=Polluticoccus soli TaxID=3034150 RepID=UPI0023E28797|nr:hypothetical protein [Flavipsychrobacter sp. JY13-12]